MRTSVKMQIGRTHHEILALGVTVLHLDPRTDQPNSGNDVAAPHPDVAAFPQCFDAVELGILNDDMAGIPQRRPAFIRQLAVPDRKAVVVPERVSQIEKAMLRFHVPALLKALSPSAGPSKEQFFRRRPSIP